MANAIDDVGGVSLPRGVLDEAFEAARGVLVEGGGVTVASGHFYIPREAEMLARRAAEDVIRGRRRPVGCFVRSRIGLASVCGYELGVARCGLAGRGARAAPGRTHRHPVATTTTRSPGLA